MKNNKYNLKKYIIQFCSFKNKRPYNEDELYFNIDNDCDDDINDVKILCVFDGHGGGNVSKFLKNNLPEYLLNDKNDYNLYKNNKINKKIIKYFDFI